MAWEKGAKRTLGTCVGVALAALAAGVALKWYEGDFSLRKEPEFQIQASPVMVPNFSGLRNIKSELEQEAESKPEAELEPEYEVENPENKKPEAPDYDLPEDELRIIQYTAERVGVEAELLMAIRKAENGGKGLEFGIMHTPAYERAKGIMEEGELRAYESEFEKQASWCAWTIKRNRERYEQNSIGDFISFLQERYCPVGADNDSNDLNGNWEQNVRFFYRKFEGGRKNGR